MHHPPGADQVARKPFPALHAAVAEHDFAAPEAVRHEREPAVRGGVLMPGVVVEEGAVVQRALVADGVRIGKGAVVGAADSEHIELVAKRVKGAE